MADTADTVAEENYMRPSRAWMIVLMLCVATVISIMDRQLLNLLIDPIRKSLAISDTQISLIQGLAFILFYTLLGIPLGRLVDRYNRRNLIIIGVMVWSIATFFCGLAFDFWSFFAARSLVGAGEAILTPAAVSMITDCFAPNRRGRAISALGFAVGVGAVSSYFIGSAVLQILPGDASVTLPGLGEVRGWQIAFFAAASPGVLVSLLLLTIKEPARRELVTDDFKQNAAWALLKAHWSKHWVALTSVFGASAFLQILSYGAHAWIATYLMRQFGLQGAQTGLLLGIVGIFSTIGGAGLCGWSSDALAKWRVGGRILAYPLFLTACLPFAFFWPLAPSYQLALVLFVVTNWTYQAPLLATPTMIQELAPNELRGVLISIYMVANGILGAGMGPILVALVTDFVFQDDQKLGLSIVVVTVPALLIALLLGLLGARACARSRREVIELIAAHSKPA